MLLFSGNVRFGGEQVLLGFPDSFIFFLHDLGLLVVLGWGLGGFFLIYSCHKKEGEEGRRRKNSSSPGWWFVEVVWAFAASLCGFAPVP